MRLLMQCSRDLNRAAYASKYINVITMGLISCTAAVRNNSLEKNYLKYFLESSSSLGQ